MLDQVFPEYADLFSDLFGATSRELLLKFSVPEEFAAVSTTKLSNFISKASKGRLGRLKAEQVKDAAQHSFEVIFAVQSFAFQLKLIIEQIGFVEQQIAELDLQITDLIKATTAFVITTITGIGSTIAAVIIGEVGDIYKFDAPKKLLAYSGLDATTAQSGQFVGTQAKVSKRGSPYLRRALYLAASIASFKDPALSLFYQKKISQDFRKRTFGNCYNQKYLDYINVDERGDLIKPDTVSSHFDVLLKQCGLPRIRFHDLRHSFASLLMACGATLKDVSEWLGHSTITITADLYSHLDYKSKLAVANTVAKIFNYERITTEEENPYEKMREIFFTKHPKTVAPPSQQIILSSEISAAAETTESNLIEATLTPKPDENNSIEEFKTARQEMSRLGFSTLDEYYEYKDFLTYKNRRANA